MRLTITISAPESDQDLLNLELSPSTSLADLKSLIESETKFPPTEQHIYFNGNLLNTNTKSLEELGITDGDMLATHVMKVRHQRNPGGAEGSGRGSGGREEVDPEQMRLAILQEPDQMFSLRERFPELIAAVNDPQQWREKILQQRRSEEEAHNARVRRIEALNADPFNEEYQKEIAERIRQEQVMENLQNAMEYNPEQAFGSVIMLYIDVEVNGHKVKAFVDSGAQTTIMSPDCAEACSIMYLIDKRYQGTAYGVGTAAILGRVHSAPIKIGSLFLPCTFTVMEGKNVDLLLGLDMLKRHQACIDLNQNKLLIQGEVVPFLGEGDIPKRERELREEEPTIPGPAGTEIGASSGTVSLANKPSASESSSAQSAPPRTAAAPPTSSSSTAPRNTRTPATQTQPQTNTSRYPEEKIAQLQGLGFTRLDAIAALDATDGNVDYAAGLLFSEQ